MQFSPADVRRFADWSGDHNPLHTDPGQARRTFFGQPIVHGMLSALEAVGCLSDPQGLPLTEIDLEFRTAILPGRDYEIETAGALGAGSLAVRADGHAALLGRATFGEPPSTFGLPAAWAGTTGTEASAPSQQRDTPADREIRDFERPIELRGTYAARTVPDDYVAGPLTPLHARVFALCSYLVGMELPGLRSVFTRAVLQFAADDPGPEPLLYRARTVRFDPHFRMLETDLEVADGTGRLVAAGTLRSYVRFSPVVTDLGKLAARLSPSASGLQGKVALVCGGSRGLGADIAAGLALAGCSVYATYRSDGEAARELAGRLAARGAGVELLHGDVGDPTWCEATRRTLEDRHGGLDLLVLNACAPPAPLPVGPDSGERFDAYVASNLRLVRAPLAAFLPTLDAHGGTVAYVSSSFVEETPPGFAHYVALKEAGEGLVRTAVREASQACALIARPPRLQTAWNDTPTGVLGTIPADWAALHIVNRLADGWQAGRVEVLSEYPPFAEEASPAAEPARPDFTLAVASSFTAEPIAPGLGFWLDQSGVRAHVQFAPYGQVLQSLLDPSSPLSTNKRGLNVVLLRVKDWLRELPGEKAGSVEFLEPYFGEAATDVERAMKSHRAQAGAETLLVLCPSDGSGPGPVEELVRSTGETLAAALAGVPGLSVVDAASLHGLYGVDAAAVHDGLREHIAHVPYTSAYFHVLATIVARQAHRKIAPVRKVVVVDCDNTLWKGVVGEVGAEGIEFDAGHRRLHEKLVRLSQNGVLVALCSKNVEADVWQVFDARPDFGLPREAVVAAMINWQPKSENLRALASRLNLGLDSFVFLDDNPVECAEVRAGCPEVLTLQWPTDPEQAQRLLDHAWELDEVEGTAEDRKRTQMYREEAGRQALRDGALTFRDFLESLNLVVDVRPLDQDDLKRASQLTLRTNQFNFTTRRRDETEMQALMAAGTHEIRTLRVSDRFGDYGLVGLLVAEPKGEVLDLDTFLMSCRVLGRGAEYRMASELGRIAEACGASTVRLRVITTKRNAPARAFLETIAPEGSLAADDAGAVCEVPTAYLVDLRFEPTEAAGAADAEPLAPQPAAAAPGDGGQSLREREALVARTAVALSTMAGLERAIDGRHAAGPTPAAAVDGDVESVVVGAFASALRMPDEKVRALDRLEALGCDSFKIVEITVALSETFPWLPTTLLFEHRSVSEISRHIVELSRGQREAAPASASVRSGASPGSERPTSSDIAVVGLDVRCAGARSARELWDLLSAGRVAVGPVPVDRRHFIGRLADKRPHWAGLIDDPDLFDAEFFGISPREAELMDPQLRVFLQVAWGALEDAGCVGDRQEADTGVFAGVMYSDYARHANEATRESESPYKSWESFSLANRLSQVLGFRGPSVAVDTACSSSGTALHLACRALRDGDCRVAVVGGVNLILDPDRFAQLGRLGILSASGRCVAFGAEADGTLLGEGVGVVVLRPLDEAVARGDRIYGVIKGTGVSTGSGTVGFTAPNPQAQAQAIRRALGAAGVDPRTISYVETHGTGTLLGDPIEVRGLTLAYADEQERDPQVTGTQRCGIGSIKPNIGHLEAGAGVLGLIKVLLQLQRGMLVPSVTSEEPNPQIPFKDTPFHVQRALAPWERPVLEVDGRAVTFPRRAGLSSFGVGGANAHVIIEEAPSREGGRPDEMGDWPDGKGDWLRFPQSSEGKTVPVPLSIDRPWHVLALSARSDESLALAAGSFKEFLEREPDGSLADVCFSANTTRKVFDRRLAVVAPTRAQMIDALAKVAAGGEAPNAVRGVAPRSGEGPKIAFLFTGQGSQYAGMGRQLYDTQPVFRDALDRCAAIFDRELGKFLLSLLFAEEGSDDGALLNQTGYTQPALFAFEYAVAQMWRSWGVEPAAVMGHSVGEIGALCVAGGLSLEDGLRLIAARGRLMQALPAGGAMTSVMAPEARVAEAVADYADRVSIAGLNGPTQTVISGDGVAVAEIVARLAADGIKTKALVVSHAFHSPLMRPMAAEFEQVVRSIAFAAPAIPFVSCVDGRLVTHEVTKPEYWIRQVLDPVRFMAGMAALEELGVGAYLEVGPQPVLLGLGRQCVGDAAGEREWLPSMRKDGDAWQTLATSLAKLYVQGAGIDWQAFDAPFKRQRVSVPGYAFARKRHWLRALEGRERRSEVPSLGRALATTRGAQAYVVDWKPRGRQGGAPPRTADGRWVVLADGGGTGARLAAALGAAGAETVLVNRGARYVDSGDGAFSVNPASPGDYDQLLRSVASNGRSVRGFVHLWSLDARDGGRAPSPETVRRAQSVVVESAVHLAQALGRAEMARKPGLWFVTRGAIATGEAAGGSATALAVEHAALWGLGRTLALEQPDLWGGLIDLDGEPAGLDVESLALELLAPEADDQVALRPEGRYVPRLVPVEVSPARETALAADGTYLVTGGLGALGLRAASWLASKGAGSLVLTSRRGERADNADAARRSLEALGAKVSLVAADVSRPEDIDRVLEAVGASGAPLRGVVHAAGIDVPAALADLDVKTMHDVLSPKVEGAWLLHEATLDRPLDFFVTFSSIASVIGAVGRAHYGAANAFLDALAHERHRLGLQALSVNWGPWKGGGMATDESLRQFERVGNRGLDPSEALQVLDRLLGGSHAQVVVADIDWPAFRSVYEARRTRPLISEAEPRVEVPAEPVERATQPDRPAWVGQLLATTPDRRLAELTALLRREAAETLGSGSADEVPVDHSFYEMGMDSLMSAEFAGRLEKRLGVKATRLVFDHPHLEPLAAQLLDRLSLPSVPDADAGLASPAETATEAGAPATADRSWRTRLDEAAPDRRVGLLAELIRGEAAATLGLTTAGDVPPDRTFYEMGMDSLMAVEFAGRLQRQLGVSDSRLVFDHPDVQALAAYLDGRVPRAETRAVVGYSPEIEDEVFAFQKAAWPRRRADWIAPRWRWMFVDSARRLGVEPRVWLYRDGGRIVGHNGAIPVRLKVGREERLTAWLVDTMVLAEYRSQALGSRLMVEAHEDLPFALSLGQTEQMRQIQLQLGWVQVAPLQVAQLLIRPERVLRGKLPGPVALAAGWGFRASDAARNLLRHAPPGQVRQVSRFDARHDRLWEAMARDVNCAVVRDASYLNWKYVDQPGQEFVRLEATDGDAVLGVVVLMFHDADEHYRYRRGFIVDVVAPLSDERRLLQLLQVARQASVGHEADALTCLHVDRRLTRALRQFGFLLRDPSRFLLVRPESLDDRAGSALRASDGWFVTHGDSDIDRPW